VIFKRQYSDDGERQFELSDEELAGYLCAAGRVDPRIVEMTIEEARDMVEELRHQEVE
jgi:hypothetical protein